MRMFGVPIKGPYNMYFDNESIYKNVIITESFLSKKHHSFAYHMCWELVDSGIVRIGNEGTSKLLAGLFTNNIPRVVRDILLDIFLE